MKSENLKRKNLKWEKLKKENLKRANPKRESLKIISEETGPEVRGNLKMKRERI